MAISVSPTPANNMMPNDVVYGRQMGRDVQFKANQLPVAGAAGPPGATGPAYAPPRGTFTAAAGAGVTVADANVTAHSVIVITVKTPAGTVGKTPSVKTVTPGTGFTVQADANDSSHYNYAIIN
jgi:hypothetical protein